MRITKPLACLSAVLLAGVVYAGATSASSAQPVPRPQAASPEVQAAAPSTSERRLSDLVLSAQRQGLTSAQLDRLLERRGYTVVSTGVAPTTRTQALRSGSGSIKLYPPKLLHDEGKKWHWIATYAWQNSSFSDDQHWSCRVYDRCKLPGADGFAIAFDRRLNMTGYWATFGGREGGGVRILDPWSRSRWGVAYRKQDIVNRNASPDDLNMYYGNIAVSITGRPCGYTNAYTKYAHTWDERALPGVSLSAGSISFSFGSEGSKWQKASQPGRSRKRC